MGRTALRDRLRELAAQHIWIGTSSWKYDGWLGQIYNPERYMVRGKFSKRKFETECLAEYAEVFPAVCGDFTFYRYPTLQTWKNLFAGAPESLRFVFKAPEEVTVETFPKHPRYGARGGAHNGGYLDADFFTAEFLAPLESYRDRLGPIVFEFGARSKPAAEFVDDLSGFLAALPREFRYAVEIRNADYFHHRYFECLRANQVAHVFNAWTRTPPLEEQVDVDDAFTTDLVVSRALLRHHRVYADAVDRFMPYDKIREKDPGTRDALRHLIQRAKKDRRAAFIFVNNRLEGNAPETIRAVIADQG